jgi:hypothetical protein
MSRSLSEKTRPAEGPAGQGGTFLERALERALLTLDGDASLGPSEREAAKAALAAALACEIRDVLAAARSPGAAARALAAASARPFARAAGATKAGYFREPGAVVGLDSADAEVRLTGGTATWIRLMPGCDPGRTWTAAALKAALKKGRVLPIFADARGAGELRAHDGAGVFTMSPTATQSSGVVFAFRSGEVWAVDTYVQDALSEQQPNRAILTLEPQLTAAFEAYVGLLDRLGAPGPYRWVIGMDGLMGRSMALEDGAMSGLLRGESVLNTVVTEGDWDGTCSVEEAIQPFFDDLLKACSTPVG